MKLLIVFLKRLSKKRSKPSPFTEAIREGIKDAFREMGYRFDDKVQG